MTEAARSLRDADPRDADLVLVEVRRDAETRSLALAWSDGSRAVPSYDVLQGYCPCAHCRGHDGGDIAFQTPDRPVRTVEVAPVGNYAIHISFEPGCNAGIFGFDFLRAVCRREGILEGDGTEDADGGESQ